MEAQQIAQGGQSVCYRVKTQKGNIYLLKEFLTKTEYNHEKKIYQHLNEITKEIDLSILKMIDHDDHKCQIVFPFINFQLALICSKVKENNARGMKWILALYHFTQVVNTIKKLHSLNLCHCDIKVDNILVEQQSNGLKDILIDFGHCQSKKQNEKSEAVCGTLTYNPLELNEGIAKQQIKEYSPYMLDLFQLGMLLLTLIVYFPISEQNKKLISLKKKNKFLECITLKYKKTYNTNLQMKSEVYDLIWDLLTGKIEDAASILDHEVYDLQEVKKMFTCLPQTGNTKASQMEEEEEYFNFNNITFTKKDDGNRSEGTVSIEKEFQKMLQESTKYEELKEQIIQFCDKNPRQIKESELQKRSFLLEMNTSQILQLLLYCFHKNNSDVFDQNIFEETQNLTLKATLQYTSKDVITEDSTDDDDDDDLKEPKIEEIKNDIELQVEIVMIEELKQTETKSIIFTPIKGESIYYNNLIEDILGELEKLI
ncbi:kinase domain protein (macronuclear) [Tetrahymena thermophila SB210]|uniref:non-specific serine/threonine protein kinase n=1 Tax=Tetrahymena thermophila (strain SB210) TaxID=312017 RepID=I7M1K2_TETTS|nr:kinase domain protein [Tetrahymena thermophila SB210]EAR96499.2 kinase domain protein [Tetrahymena thermophila SB210]|eukprot:XP_001016744.2 kinase domain protein [Tetrahymena thermophila SB210]